MALVPPGASAAAMSLLLAELAVTLPPRTHAVLVLDRAGWRVAHALQVPANLTLVLQPEHAPKLNPLEKVWQYLRERFLSRRVLPDDAAILDPACDAWNDFRAEPHRLRSLTCFPWPSSIITSY